MVLKIRFGIGEWIAVVAFVGALAATVAAMALPFAYPDIPKETWRLILWPGVTILVLSAIYLTIDIFAFLFRGPKGKIATLRCSFNSTDIGGCVCPNTILRRPDRITGLRPSNASSSPTAHNLVITPNLENQGTVGPTFRTFTLDDDVNRERVTYYRIKVSAENGTVSSCRGKLVSFKRGSQKLIAKSVDLPFAPAKNSDALNKTIHVGHSEHLDFLFISDDNRVELTLPDFVGPSGVDWPNLFAAHGDHIFDIKILSPIATGSIIIVFKWTGDRATSVLAQMH